MRLMKAFQIQANYQKHKQRLTSINSLNSKQKVSNTTYKNIQFINTYKKQRLTSDIFLQKQKAKKLSLNNTHIQSTLTNIYNRDSIHGDTLQDWKISKNKDKDSKEGDTVRGRDRNYSMNRLNSKNSIRSRSKSSINSESSRIRQQNRKIGKKIQDVKSDYSKFRQTNSSRKNKPQNYREELVRLLENQLGVKPKVVFPNVRGRTKYSQKQEKQQKIQKPQRQNVRNKSTTSNSSLNKKSNTQNYFSKQNNIAKTKI